MKKMIAGMAALAAVSMLCTSVSAADWTKAYCSEHDQIVSSSEDSVTFKLLDFEGKDEENKWTIEREYAYVSVKLEDIIANPDDAKKVAYLRWKTTINGLSGMTGTGSDAYAAVHCEGNITKNGNGVSSSGFNFSFEKVYLNDDLDNVYVWEDQEGRYDSIDLGGEKDLSGDVTLTFKVSSHAFHVPGLTATISDLTIYDGDDNEIAQKAYGASSEPPATEPTQTEPPATEPTQTEPPATEPTQTEPPVTEPTETEPPATEPTETEPPVTQPTVTEPPVTQPPQTQPTVTLPTLPPAPPVSANTDIWGPGNRDYDEIQLWARYGGGTAAPRNIDNAETERIDAGAGMAGTAVSSPDGILAAAATAFAAALAVYTKKRRK